MEKSSISTTFKSPNLFVPLAMVDILFSQNIMVLENELTLCCERVEWEWDEHRRNSSMYGWWYRQPRACWKDPAVRLLGWGGYHGASRFVMAFGEPDPLHYIWSSRVTGRWGRSHVAVAQRQRANGRRAPSASAGRCRGLGTPKRVSPGTRHSKGDGLGVLQGRRPGRTGRSRRDVRRWVGARRWFGS
jgi:hypothetical protein